ncbi:hypothetical protein [Amycolatopsis sp. NPDC051061]
MKVLTGLDRRGAGLTGLVLDERSVIQSGHRAQITRSEQQKAQNEQAFGG